MILEFFSNLNYSMILIAKIVNEKYRKKSILFTGQHLEQELFFYIYLIEFTPSVLQFMSFWDFTCFLSVLVFAIGVRYEILKITLSTLTKNTL